jgi:hypothetical protein
MTAVQHDPSHRVDVDSDCVLTRECIAVVRGCRLHVRVGPERIVPYRSCTHARALDVKIRRAATASTKLCRPSASRCPAIGRTGLGGEPKLCLARDHPACEGCARGCRWLLCLSRRAGLPDPVRTIVVVSTRLVRCRSMGGLRNVHQRPWYLSLYACWEQEDIYRTYDAQLVQCFHAPPRAGRTLAAESREYLLEEGGRSFFRNTAHLELTARARQPESTLLQACVRYSPSSLSRRALGRGEHGRRTDCSCRIPRWFVDASWSARAWPIEH